MTTTLATDNVVTFPRAACERPQTWQRIWRQDELQSLVALYAAQARHSEVVAWDVGTTEAGDPQFYLIGPGPEHDCLLCVSRIGRLYVLEDAYGGLLAEDGRLGAVTDKAARALSQRHSAFVVRALLGLCAFRVMIEQKIEPFLAESTENLTRFAPQLAAFV
ncbi:MAG: hypothetical protein K2X45_05990 [Phreatobacter sp.]|nr:hypothetical protein [Phreatobacter sp.]